MSRQLTIDLVSPRNAVPAVGGVTLAPCSTASRRFAPSADMSTTASSGYSAAPAHADARRTTGGESRLRDSRSVGASIVCGDDFDVLVVVPAVRLVILDAQVREMHLIVEVRKVVIVGPGSNLFLGPIGVAVVVGALPVAACSHSWYSRFSS